MFGSTENRGQVGSVLTRPFTVWFYREQKVSEICVDKTIHMFGSTENRRYLRSVLTRPYTCLVLQRSEGI